MFPSVTEVNCQAFEKEYLQSECECLGSGGGGAKNSRDERFP